MKIQIPNPFNYSARKDFLPQILKQPVDSELILDFNGVDMLDSSALGILLMVREKSKGSGKKVTLLNCSDNIKKILEVAQFHMLFDIK
jgi:HptB-dependent secretion and biofilm anti anti-sigma factor